MSTLLLNSKKNKASTSREVFTNGDVLGDYIIEKKLGEGSTCQVYRAFDVVLHRYVAIKAILRSLVDKNAEETFIEEGRYLARMRHNNIVPIYAVGCGEATPWMALAYIEGENLDELKRPLGPAEITTFLNHATAALEYAANANIVHLDVKPSNFMMDSSGIFLLADFGIARRISDVENGVYDGMAVQGTPAFASPEHFLLEKLDVRTDIYSLGATLFHLLTGSPPFKGQSALEIGQKHVETPFPANMLVEKGVPEGMRRVIGRMLEKKPGDRFQNYQELRTALGFEVPRARTIVDTTQMRYEGRQSSPRSGGDVKDLFNMLPRDLAALGDELAQAGKMYSREEFITAFKKRGNLLKLNKLASSLKHMQFTSSQEGKNILYAVDNCFEYKESLRRVGQFMANQIEESTANDLNILELIGEDRAFKLGVIAGGLNGDWQGGVKLNHHNFWENGIYSGLLANLMADMLGYELQGLEFLCGLVHAIGRLVFLEMYPMKTIALWIKAYLHRTPTEELERKYFGVTSSEMGSRWLTLHNFDPLVCHVTGHLSTPENCYLTLSKTSSQGLFFKKCPYSEQDVLALTHLTNSAISLSKELMLGFDGCSFLEKTAWIESKATRLVFSNRINRNIRIEEFITFFTRTCAELPELPLLGVTSASAAQEREYLEKERYWSQP